tara:strand:+ start:45 stop:287 length:243 start_codon:yes stop_codon:yes gene_type:complete
MNRTSRKQKKELQKNQNCKLYVELTNNMSIDRALSEFKKRVKNSGLLKELRERQYFEKKSLKKRRLKKSRSLKIKLMQKD